MRAVKKGYKHDVRILLALSILSMLTIPAAAADAKGNYWVIGEGTVSCGGWISDRRYDPGAAPFTPTQHTTDILQEEAWVRGYITAYNEFQWKGLNVASETDNSGMYAWLDNYCAVHPTDNISKATDALVEFLSKGPHPNAK